MLSAQRVEKVLASLYKVRTVDCRKPDLRVPSVLVAWRYAKPAPRLIRQLYYQCKAKYYLGLTLTLLMALALTCSFPHSPARVLAYAALLPLMPAAFFSSGCPAVRLSALRWVVPLALPLALLLALDSS